MTTPLLWLSALPAMLGMALVAWGLSTARRNVGLVDIFWSLFLLLALVLYVALASVHSARAWLVLALVAIWSVRLAAYLAARNWSAAEDHRYRAIRERNEPGFIWKSIYLVFGLQAVLAWLISAPLAAAANSLDPLDVFDLTGTVLVVLGICIESIADAQLVRFKALTSNADRVNDRGLWRYSRHPNYFGEFLVWWGLFIIALGTGAWWTVFAPALMTVLLLKVSGVALLEKDIGERRPAYRDYRARTSAFFPWPPRSA
jgi:steroid 5-alpha reductase family enzyme